MNDSDEMRLMTSLAVLVLPLVSLVCMNFNAAQYLAGGSAMVAASVLGKVANLI